MSLFATTKYIVSHPLNKDGKIAALLRFFKWQVASRLLPYPVALPFVDDFSLFVERRMSGATGNFYCGLHEADDMAFVLHFLRDGDTFYDVGANIGSYTTLAAAAGATRIISFEPSRETCGRFERNLRLNGLSNRVELHCCALGGEDGEVRFTTGFDAENRVAAGTDNPEKTELVKLRRFDDFYQEGTPSFIKIDVEGYEAFVLSGAGRALNDAALMGVLLEDNGSDLLYENKSSVGAILKSHGFKPCIYDAASRELKATEAEMGLFGNILFLRNVDEAVVRVKTSGKFRLINGWI